jgi:DNA-binding response OmpR family regulator
MSDLNDEADRGARILIAEDDDNIRNLLTSYLKISGYETVSVADGSAALAHVASDDPYDLVVLDLMLPGVGGLEVCREIRKTGDVPVLMLTALGEEDDRVRGFELGADDYVVKPFSPRELVARVKAILRRNSVPADGSLRSSGNRGYPITVDWEGKICSHAGADLELTQSEFVILAALVRRPGVVFSRDELINLLYPGGGTVVPKAVDVHVHNIRTKLGEEGAPLIETVRSFGYRAARSR